MNVFLMCVGSRDPSDFETGKPGPILTFLKRLMADPEWTRRPDVIYLLATTGGRRPMLENAAKTKTEIEKNSLVGESEVVIMEMAIASPHIYNEVLPVMRQTVLEILAKHQVRRPKYFVNYSPGTPQMQAIWVSFVTSGILKGRLYQTIEPAGPDGSQGEVRDVEVNFVEEDLAKEKSRELFERYMFQPAVTELERLFGSIIDERRTSAKALSQLCRAYHHWDVLDYEQASDILKGAEFPHGTLKSLVARQVEVLDKIINDSEEYHLVDLYHKAHRMKKQGDIPSALTVLSTICELLAVSQVKRGFLRAFGVDVDRDFKKRIAGTAAEEWLGGVLRKIPEHLNVSPALRIWREMRSEASRFGVVSLKHSNSIEFDLRNERTKYIHRGQGVEGANFEKIVKSFRTALRDAYFGDFLAMDTYPFADASIRQVAALFPELLK